MYGFLTFLGGGGGWGSFLSHSAVSQGIIITHDDSSIKRANWRPHVPYAFYLDTRVQR